MRHHLPFHLKTFALLSAFCLLPFALSTCSYLPEEQTVLPMVSVEENRDYIMITPIFEWYSMTGLLFYPGGLVDPHAYVEPLSKFALSGTGHQIVIVKMPTNLAVLDFKKGKWVYNDFRYVRRWVVAGHSLGGTMACSLVEKYPDFFWGLVLFAAYPSESTDLSSWSKNVLSIRGEFDGLVSELDIESHAENLPEALWLENISEFPEDKVARTIYYTVPGGNHAYFGKYGEQKGDGQATISEEEQIKETMKLLQQWFKIREWDK